MQSSYSKIFNILLYAIFRKHHDKPFTDPEAKREAQKRNNLQYYYRNRSIKKYEQLNSDNATEEDLAKVQK